MLTLFLLLLIPLIWPLAAKLIYKHEITFLEMALNVLVGVAIVLAGWYAGKYGQMLDTEIVNGQVVSKYSEKVSCDHSYSCHCRPSCSGSGSSRSCSTTCDTCYEHAYDVDWKLKTTVGDIRISRVNRQGTIEPPRYTRASAGDPVAQSHTYVNYLKAAPESLFSHLDKREAMEDFAGRLPAYPGHVYDYHYVDRVLSLGVSLEDPAQWNTDLANALRDLGPSKEVNAVLVFTKDASPRIADALSGSWLGGKKNDVVVVIGAPQYPNIEWVRVLSWTPNELFKVKLRDALLDLKSIERNAVVNTLSTHIAQRYQRRHMQDFAYLESAIEPPRWVVILLVVVGLGSSVGLSIYLSRVDLFGQGKFRSRHRYTYRRF